MDNSHKDATISAVRTRIIDHTISFEGPFQYLPGRNSVFDQTAAGFPGIYLWTIEHGEKYLINYVGITGRPISHRLQDHLAHYYRGDYTIYEPQLFIKGEKQVMYRPSGSILEFVPEFLTLAPAIDSQIKTYRLFIAKAEGSKEWLERIESGIINKLRDSGGKAVEFLDNYRISRDVPEADKVGVKIISPVELVGLGISIRA